MKQEKRKLNNNKKYMNNTGYENRIYCLDPNKKIEQKLSPLLKIVIIKNKY
jgi:hypothetical protein